MASSRLPPVPPARPLDLEVTLISAKHLKNVNWKHGDLKPYAVAYLEPDRRVATKADDAGNTRPVWNERLLLPLSPSLLDPTLLLTIDVFHSKPSETPKPLVGTAHYPLKGLLGPDAFEAATSSGVSVDGCPSPIKILELCRPSGRPQGKIRIKVAIRERPCPPPEPADQFAPSGYYYSTAPLPSAREYGAHPPPPSLVPPYSHPVPLQPSPSPYGDHDPYSGYYSSNSGYYSAPPVPAPAPAPAPAPPPARPYYDRVSAYGGPSAPVDYSSGFSSYEQKAKGSRLRMGAGLAVGAVAGALGGLAVEGGLKYEEEKVAERVESDLTARDDYRDYRADY